MKLFRDLVAVILFLVATAGCDNESAFYPQSAPASLRRTVILDFANDPVYATTKYKELWIDAVEKGDAEVPTGALLAMAAGLMKHDNDNYKEYYKFVINKSESPDERVVVFSISALSRAHGVESLETLIDFTNDNRYAVSREAMTAINYRLVESMGEPALHSEYEYMRAALPELCSNQHRNELYDFCSNRD